MPRALVSLICLAVFVVGFSAGATETTGNENEIRFAAGGSALAAVFSKVKDAFTKETGIRLNYIGSDPGGAGADAVMKAVDAGEVECGVSGIYWTDWLKIMEDGGYKIKNLQKMKYVVLGHDVTKIFTSKKPAPKELSNDQLRLIFTGQLTNWKTITGDDLPIKLVYFKGQPANEKFMSKRIMRNEPYSRKDAVMTEQVADFVKAVASTPGSIALGSTNWVDATLHIPATDSFLRPVTFVTIGAPTPKVQKFLDFVREKGKSLGVE